MFRRIPTGAHSGSTSGCHSYSLFKWETEGFVRVECLLPIKSLRSEPRGLTDGWEALANERRDLRSALCTPRIRIRFSVQHRRHNEDKNTRKWQFVLYFWNWKSGKSSCGGAERLNYKKRKKKRKKKTLSFLLEVTLVSVFLHSSREHCILKHFWWSRGVLDTQRHPRFHPRTLSRHEGCCDRNSNILFQQESRVSEFLSQTLHLSCCLCLLGIWFIYLYIYIYKMRFADGSKTASEVLFINRNQWNAWNV